MSIRKVKLTLFFVACSLTGQVPHTYNVNGEIIQQGGPSVASRLMVEIRDLSDSTLTQRAPVHPDGSFELREVKTGHYRVSVTDLQGDSLQDDVMQIQDGAPLVLRLAASRREVPASGTVSVAALQVSPKAVKEFDRARKAAEAGDSNKVIESLERAVSISPQFKEAHNNLGASYVALKKYDQAETSFRKAVEIDPQYAAAWRNLSVAAFRLGRLEEAEDAARHMAALPGDASAANYMLGVALVAQEKYTPEALASLRSTEATFPAARLLATEVLIRQGRLNEAVNELHSFLNVAPAKPGP